MPAIRYRYHSVAVVLTHALQDERFSLGSRVAELRLRDGREVRINFGGYVCLQGLPFMGPGKYGKLIAREVSDGDGIRGTWRTVTADEFVLCWRTIAPSGETIAAHAIVDKHGWPIVMSNKRRPAANSCAA